MKSGRTHLMDATPVTLGQEFGGYAAQVRLRRRAAASRRCPGSPSCRWAAPRSAPASTRPPGFAGRGHRASSPSDTGLPLTEARNHFEAQGARDALVELSGQLRTIAVGLTKICNDLRWMGSGPRTGLAEIHLPDLQPGSSIMPGKVNPVLPEATLMVCAQVIGNDAAVAFAGAAGNFELNVMMPVMARNLLESIRLLANAQPAARRPVRRRHHRRRRAAAASYAESSPSIVTPLNRYIGYEDGREGRQAGAGGAARRSARSCSSWATSSAATLTEEQLDEALDVLRMTHP